MMVHFVEMEIQTAKTVSSYQVSFKGSLQSKNYDERRLDFFVFWVVVVVINKN